LLRASTHPQFSNQMMSYLLFDLAVLVSSIAATHSFLRDGGYSLWAPEPDSKVKVTDGNMNQVPVPWQHHDQPGTQQHETFATGDYVEVFDPNIHQSCAFFAKIIHEDTQDDGSSKYEIRSFERAREIFQDIEPSRIRAQEHLEFRSRVMCDMGNSIGSSSDLYPCIVLSYADKSTRRPFRGDKTPSYYVLTTIHDQVQYLHMPMSRIRPIIHMSSSLEDEFKRLASSDPSTDDVDVSDHVQVRGVVEFDHDASNRFGYAAPLVITDRTKDGILSLHHTVFARLYSRVIPAYTRPYHVYGSQTKAGCLVGKADLQLCDKSLIPCTVLSHSTEKSGTVLYQVSYLNKQDGTLVRDQLSFTKVHRVIGNSETNEWVEKLP